MNLGQNIQHVDNKVHILNDCRSKKREERKISDDNLSLWLKEKKERKRFLGQVIEQTIHKITLSYSSTEFSFRILYCVFFKKNTSPKSEAAKICV